MVDNVVPYLLNVGDVLPARSKGILLSEMAMALVECLSLYGKRIKKFGKIHRIAQAFWPVRLIPLTETRASVCSYLLNKVEKLNVGNFATAPPNPENVIKASDPTSFLNSLQSYDANYLKKGRNYKRGTVIQEALFNSNETEYFKNFFLNQYNLSLYKEPYFVLEGGPIAKSVNQTKIVQEIYNFVNLKDIEMLDDYGTLITKLCDKWIMRGSQEADKLRGSKADTREEEKQLSLLNSELQAEKERKLDNTPEDLLRRRKHKIPNKSDELSKGVNSLKNSVEKLRGAINQQNLFLVEEGLTDLDQKYRGFGNSISRYKSEINQLKKNINREISDIERAHRQKISSLEKKISEVQKQIDAKHGTLSSDVSSAEDIIAQIRKEKQSCLDAIEAIKDSELTNIQRFLNNYTIEIKTKNIVVGIPIFVFYFVDPSTNKSIERAPVLPIMISKGKVVRTKITADFRNKIRDLMNKFPPMINLVETEGERCNLMEMKNLDTHLEDAINDLRIRKILNKKQCAQTIEIINNIIW